MIVIFSLFNVFWFTPQSVEAEIICDLEIVSIELSSSIIRVGDKFRVSVLVRNNGIDSLCISPSSLMVEWVPENLLKAHTMFCGEPPLELSPEGEVVVYYCGYLEALKPGLVTLKVNVWSCPGLTSPDPIIPGKTICGCIQDVPYIGCKMSKEFILEIKPLSPPTLTVTLTIVRTNTLTSTVSETKSVVETFYIITNITETFTKTQKITFVTTKELTRTITSTIWTTVTSTVTKIHTVTTTITTTIIQATFIGLAIVPTSLFVVRMKIRRSIKRRLRE